MQVFEARYRLSVDNLEPLGEMIHEGFLNKLMQKGN